MLNQFTPYLLQALFGNFTHILDGVGVTPTKAGIAPTEVGTTPTVAGIAEGVDLKQDTGTWYTYKQSWVSLWTNSTN